ncbi:MAG TPA: hypothetical protein VHU80_14625, partial [Polyangiaceae bacterium]|nr:hypothetical protein [Polyangiaceae bacterium]
MDSMHSRCYLTLALFGSAVTLFGCGGDSKRSEGGAAGNAGSSGTSSSRGTGGARATGGTQPGGGGNNAAGRSVGAGGNVETGGGNTSAAGATSSGGAGGTASGGAGGTASVGGSGGAIAVSAGWNLVAIDTPRRTYLDYVEVPASGTWKPETDHFPALATWENQTAYSALRFQPYKPGDALTPAQIMALLPVTRRASVSISITDKPYQAPPAPADATSAIQKALDDAAAMAKPASPVDVLVPTGTFAYSAALRIGADVRLRRFPEDTGGALHATNPANSAIHLAGDRSGALFLELNFGAKSRDTTARASGIWVGNDDSNGAFVHDTLVIGNEVAQSASAHVFAAGEDGGTWAFNYAHDGYADTFHHTGGSRYCQVVGNRAQTAAGRGDDLYAFVSYQGDGDVVHHCACIANWGRDGAARG